MPLAKSGDTTVPGGTAGPASTDRRDGVRNAEHGARAARAHAPRPVLSVNEVNVDFAVVPGTGERLGNLLCEVTSLVDGSARPAELVNRLNTLLDTIG